MKSLITSARPAVILCWVKLRTNVQYAALPKANSRGLIEPFQSGLNSGLDELQLLLSSSNQAIQASLSQVIQDGLYLLA